MNEWCGDRRLDTVQWTGEGLAKVICFGQKENWKEKKTNHSKCSLRVAIARTLISCSYLSEIDFRGSMAGKRGC